jgi:hypothetical protein
MSDITLAQAQAHLTSWLNADTAVASGQAYSIGDRSLTRANAAEIRRSVDYWRNVVTRLESGSAGARVMRALPRDL